VIILFLEYSVQVGKVNVDVHYEHPQYRDHSQEHPEGLITAYTGESVVVINAFLLLEATGYPARLKSYRSTVGVEFQLERPLT
jgi:hypothetical protein